MKITSIFQTVKTQHSFRRISIGEIGGLRNQQSDTINWTKIISWRLNTFSRKNTRRRDRDVVVGCGKKLKEDRFRLLKFVKIALS